MQSDKNPDYDTATVHPAPSDLQPVTPVNATPATPTVIGLPTTPQVTTVTDAGKSTGTSTIREVFNTIGILGTALVIALLMIGFVFRSYQVDGPSMQNTLQNADKLIVWKVPRTIARFTHHAYIPDRGDIIIFTEAGLSQYGQEDSKQLVKRVIALPGDHILLKDGHYTVTNAENPKGFDPDQTLGYGKNFPYTSGDIDITLAANQIFVSGDNRPNSLDSRAFGPINADQVIGRLVARVFPISQAKSF